MCDLIITLSLHAKNEEQVNMAIVSALTESKGFDGIQIQIDEQYKTHIFRYFLLSIHLNFYCYK